MNFTPALLLTVLLLIFTLTQENKCSPLPSKEQIHLEKRTGTRFKIAATRAHAAIYNGISKTSYATGAGKVGGFFSKLAGNKQTKAGNFAQAAQMKAREGLLGI